MIRAGEMVSRVIWRLIQAVGEIFDWWNSLDTQSKKVITTFGAFTAAIWALNRAFFSSPIGIITGLVAALLYCGMTIRRGRKGEILYRLVEVGARN